MTRRHGIGFIVSGLLLVGTGLAAQEAEREDSVAVDDDDRAEYADLEEVIVRGRATEWRLTDEDREKIWREVEGDPPPPEGAAAVLGKGRFKTEVLPMYDPENPTVIDMGIDGQRSEAVELFRVRF